MPRWVQMRRNLGRFSSLLLILCESKLVMAAGGSVSWWWFQTAGCVSATAEDGMSAYSAAAHVLSVALWRRLSKRRTPFERCTTSNTDDRPQESMVRFVVVTVWLDVSNLSSTFVFCLFLTA